MGTSNCSMKVSLLFVLCAMCVTGAVSLQPRAFIPLHAGATTPKGWLLSQLKLQANGLSGHLSEFWDDVMKSVWIGGAADGGLHERTPYWLNGIVPLAYLLKNAGAEKLGPVSALHKHAGGSFEWKQFQMQSAGALCKNNTDLHGSNRPATGSSGSKVSSAQECHDACDSDPLCGGFVIDQCSADGSITCWNKDNQPTPHFHTTECRCYGQVRDPPKPTPVDVLEQAQRYMDYIRSQQATDGWLGPAQVSGGDYWGRSNIMFAMLQYAEAEPDLYSNITGVMLKYMLSSKARLSKTPLASWAAERWMDMAYSVVWMLEQPAATVQGHEAELQELADMLHSQGVDWEQWFETFTGNAGGHNVNNAQGIKSSGVWFLLSGNKSLPALSRSRMEHLDETYGLPTGMYNGDEILPSPATRSPSRGIELCGVVEAMFSWNILFSVHGDVAFADRAERISFNALPATWASPKGGDMWAHQYLQAVNEVNAIRADPHVWQHDGDMSETYGLEPNFGCCTANFNQGWPKFANMLVYGTQDGGAAVGIYAPATVKLPDNSTVEIVGNYPFDDQMTVNVQATKEMPLYLRIPGWATAATVNGDPTTNGTMHKVSCPVGWSTVDIQFNPEIRFEAWTRVDAEGKDDAATVYSVHRGALMYSLPIQGNYTVTANHFGSEGNDYEVVPTTAWNVALDLKAAPLKYVQAGYLDGSAPFNHTGWPTYIEAKVRQVPGWGIELNSAATPPASPACASAESNCGEPYTVKLVPHGGTDLRIGEMPFAF